MKNIKKISLLASVMLFAILCSLFVFADGVVRLNPKGNKNIVVTREDEKFELEVEVENAPENIIYGWYKVDEKGVLINDTSISNTSKLTVKKFPAEFTGQKEYYQCMINYGDDYSKKQSVVFTVTYENEEETEKLVKVVRVEELSKPTKREYKQGDSLDLSGLTLKLVTSDGSTPNALVGTEFGKFLQNDFIAKNKIRVTVNPVALKDAGVVQILINVGTEAEYSFGVKVEEVKTTETDIVEEPETKASTKAPETTAETEVISEDNNDNQNGGIKLWLIIVLIIAACIVGIGGTLLVIFLINRRKRKKEEEMNVYNAFSAQELSEKDLVDSEIIEEELGKDDDDDISDKND